MKKHGNNKLSAIGTGEFFYRTKLKRRANELLVEEHRHSDDVFLNNECIKSKHLINYCKSWYFNKLEINK